MTDESLTPLEEEEPYIPGDDVPEYPHDDPDGDRTEFINHPRWQDIEEIPEVDDDFEVEDEDS